MMYVYIVLFITTHTHRECDNVDMKLVCVSFSKTSKKQRKAAFERSFDEEQTEDPKKNSSFSSELSFKKKLTFSFPIHV